MYLYIVQKFYPYEGTDIQAIYDNREQAIALLQALEAKEPSGYDNWEIEVIPINTVVEYEEVETFRLVEIDKIPRQNNIS